MPAMLSPRTAEQAANPDGFSATVPNRHSLGCPWFTVTARQFGSTRPGYFSVACSTVMAVVQGAQRKNATQATRKQATPIISHLSEGARQTIGIRAPQDFRWDRRLAGPQILKTGNTICQSAQHIPKQNNTS